MLPQIQLIVLLYRRVETIKRSNKVLLFVYFLIVLPILLGYCEAESQKTTSTHASPSRIETVPQRATPVPAEDREALLDSYFDQLKDLDVNYKVIGYILEKLAKIQLQSAYPRGKYEIIGGLQYQEAGGRTVGELDIVVLDREAGTAELVAEAKLSGNLYRAGRKASSQLGRFQNYLNSGKIAKFHFIENPSRVFTMAQFKDVDEYWRIGNTGAIDAGFDYEIDLTREEGDILQQRLLAYKATLTPATPAAATAVPATDKPFIGNRRSKALHYHTCKSLPAPHNCVYFSSVEEAQKAGYAKLHSCIPATSQ